MRWIAPLLLSCLMFGQEDTAPSIKVDVDVVNVLFNVRDKKSGLIGNLNKDDFTIF